MFATGGVDLSLGIAIEQTRSFLHQFVVTCDDSKAATSFNIEMRKVVGKNVQFLAVHDHHLAVITHQIIGSPGDGDALVEEPRFELAQGALAPSVRKSDECVNKYTALSRIFQSSFNLRFVKAEDHDLNTFLGLLDGFDQGRHAIRGLNNQLQSVPRNRALSESTLRTNDWMQLRSAALACPAAKIGIIRGDSVMKPITKLRSRISLSTLLAAVLLCLSSAAAAPVSQATHGSPIIWSDPGDIGSKDLFNGPGGQEHRPALPAKFLKEDSSGHNSKFDIADAKGKKWKAKLGIEAQPEVVATRLLWAIGYFTNDNYFISDLTVKDLPEHLHRGEGHVIAPGHVEKVRLQRHLEGKKSGQWAWRHNPLVGSREYNGLRVMMALIANWDLKNENNAIYDEKDGAQRYMVTDVGTAFGASGDRWTEAQSKNNLKAYESAKFIGEVTPKYVNFSFPRFPPFLYVFDLPHFVHQVSLRWVGNHIPRQDAKWVGSLLAQLSHKQIEDAFRAGGYSPEQVEAYSRAVAKRIAELKQL